MTFPYHDWSDEYAFDILVDQLEYLRLKFRNSDNSGRTIDNVIDEFIRETQEEFDGNRIKHLDKWGYK